MLGKGVCVNGGLGAEGPQFSRLVAMIEQG